MPLSPEAIRTLNFLRSGQRLPTRSYFELTPGGIVIREIPLRFTSPTALGLVRTDTYPRIFDPDTGSELPRVRLWIRPEDISKISEWLQPYRRPRRLIQIFEVQPRAYQTHNRQRVWSLELKTVGEIIPSEAIEAIQQEETPFRLSTGSAATYQLPQDHIVFIATYPDKPSIILDATDDRFYGLVDERDSYSFMQFNQAAAILTQRIARAYPKAFAYLRVESSFTPEEEERILVLQQERGI
ncbi:MAG: hypothetical protein QXG05_08040 [Nitrososphaerota archaeon]